MQLHVYDLSQGMARQLSPMLLGQQVGSEWSILQAIFPPDLFCNFATHHMCDTMVTHGKSDGSGVGHHTQHNTVHHAVYMQTL